VSKACTKCKLVKELTLFSPNKRVKDGRQARCKACDAAEKALLLQDPEYRSKKNARMRHYAATHRAADLASSRASQIRRLGHPNQARPAWVDPEFADLVFSEAYRLAECRKEITGFDWHVDHIIPLKSKLVSGLHVPTNIQVIPAAMNLRKGDRFVVA
jgi:hypothetical protein